MGADPFVSRVALNVDGIPEELRALRHWIAWNLEPPKKPGDKPRKIPKNPRTGANASSTDPKSWGTLAEAVAATSRYRFSGIGFVLTGSGFTGIDLDACRDPETGAIDPSALATMSSVNSYTELSPSGTGVHIIVRAALPGKGIKVGKREVYDNGRYFTFTGVAQAGTTTGIADRQTEVESFYRELLDEREGSTRSPDPDATEDLDDDTLIARARLAKNGSKFAALFDGDTSGYSSSSEADMALCAILAFWSGDDAKRIDRLFRRSKLIRDKWDEQRGEQTYGVRTIAEILASRPGAGGNAPSQSSAKKRRGPRPLTDSGNAERLVDLFGGDLRYCHAQRRWYAWKGTHWSDVPDGSPLLRTKEVARSIIREAANIYDLELREKYLNWANTSEKAERRNAMLTLAQAEPGIPIQAREFNRDPYLFNCANGTLVLNTGKPRPHSREDYITKLCPTNYVPDALCPRWDAFLERVLPDDETRSYAQRFFGYSISGDVSEHVLLITQGPGANGKSTFICALQYVYSADYAIQIAPDILVARSQRGHPTEIADLFGTRLAVGTETAKGQHLDEPTIKQLTGGDLIRARRMREDFWQFEATHHLVLVTNHPPIVSATDPAMLRRLHRLRFDVTIPEKERNKRLLRELRAEREGILGWLVRGYLAWRKDGLCPPDDVRWIPTEEQADPTPVEQFIAECVVRKSGARTKASVIFDAFVWWCTDRNLASCSKTELGTTLGANGFGKKKSDTFFYLDLQLENGTDRDTSGHPGTPFALNGLLSPTRDSMQAGVPTVPTVPTAFSNDGVGEQASSNLTPCINVPCDVCGSSKTHCDRDSGEIGCGECDRARTHQVRPSEIGPNHVGRPANGSGIGTVVGTRKALREPVECDGPISTTRGAP